MLEKCQSLRILICDVKVFIIKVYYLFANKHKVPLIDKNFETCTEQYYNFVPFWLQVWFKNRRAKWRKQKREEQERMRKLQEEDVCRVVEQPRLLAPPQHYSEDDSSDLEVA